MFLRNQKRTGGPLCALSVGRPDPKKRPDYKEENSSAQRLSRSEIGVWNKAETPRHFGARDARQALPGIGVTLQVAVVQQPDTVATPDEHRALVVDEGLERLDRATAVIEQPLPLVVQDEGRICEIGRAHV